VKIEMTNIVPLAVAMILTSAMTAPVFAATQTIYPPINTVEFHGAIGKPFANSFTNPSVSHPSRFFRRQRLFLNVNISWCYDDERPNFSDRKFYAEELSGNALGNVYVVGFITVSSLCEIPLPVTSDLNLRHDTEESECTLACKAGEDI
jgi:hypothetical protein